MTPFGTAQATIMPLPHALCEFKPQPSEHSDDAMSDYRHLRRTDLFLVRIWLEDAGGAEDTAGETSGGGSAGGEAEWCGRVQRVVDGESHAFRSWKGLVDSLEAMISHSEGR